MWMKPRQLSAVSSAALDGADLWIEEVVHDRIFMKNGLASAMQDAGLAKDWRLHECQILELAR
jgi:hypothetical protein